MSFTSRDVIYLSKVNNRCFNVRHEAEVDALIQSTKGASVCHVTTVNVTKRPLRLLPSPIRAVGSGLNYGSSPS